MTINTGYGTVQAIKFTDHKNLVKYVCKHCLLSMIEKREAFILTQVAYCYPHVDVERNEENGTEIYTANIATVKYLLQTEYIKIYNATKHRYLHEGYIYKEQKILNRYKCSTCHRSLREDCTDY